jgi:AcrR family transcriptional regulator
MADPLTRDSWTDAALAALARDGIDTVRVESLARSLGVTKGSFYWHFRDRGELLDAMLARWEEVATQGILDQAARLSGPPEARLVALFELILAARIMDLEVAVRAWGRRDERVARAVCRVDQRRLEYNQRLLQELGLEPDAAEARAFLAYSMLFGDHFVAATGGAARRRALLERCGALLLGTPRTASDDRTPARTPARKARPPRGR